MNKAMETALITNRVMMMALPQPSALPRIRASTSVNSETEKVATPIQSTLWPVGSRDSCTLARVSATATTPIGTLTKKIQRQPTPVVRAPPMSGPTATAPPSTAP